MIMWISPNSDRATVTRFRCHRTVELKHGRIAMLTTRPHIHAGNHELYHTDFTAEAVSGRLATTEIIGVFFQDGLTGSIRSDRALYIPAPSLALRTTRVFRDQMYFGISPKLGWERR